MIKRANRESRPVPSPSCRTPSSVCRTFNRATPPFRNHPEASPRRCRGDHGRSWNPIGGSSRARKHPGHPFLRGPPIPQDQLQRFSSFQTPPPTPYGGSIYTRFNLAIPPPLPLPQSSSLHRRRCCFAGGVAVRKNRIKDVANNAWAIYARILFPSNMYIYIIFSEKSS